MSDTDEFYIGYLPSAPNRLARRTRVVAAALVAVAGALALLLAFGHGRLPASIFEFQQNRTFEGTVRERPYPMLVVERPGRTGELPAFSQYLLVAPGKHGATSTVAGFDGKRVTLEGSLVYRDGRTMVEVVPDSVREQGSRPAGSGSRAEEVGVFTLAGEIVDSKCYLGVMNPGSSKPHRDCAVRCISGGAPPLFVVRDAEGRSAELLLVGADGRAINRELLDMVAEPIEITGRVERWGDLLVLRAEPATYRRSAANLRK